MVLKDCTSKASGTTFRIHYKVIMMKYRCSLPNKHKFRKYQQVRFAVETFYFINDDGMLVQDINTIILMHSETATSTTGTN